MIRWKFTIIVIVVCLLIVAVAAFTIGRHKECIPGFSRPFGEPTVYCVRDQ